MLPVLRDGSTFPLSALAAHRVCEGSGPGEIRDAETGRIVPVGLGSWSQPPMGASASSPKATHSRRRASASAIRSEERRVGTKTNGRECDTACEAYRTNSKRRNSDKA